VTRTWNEWLAANSRERTELYRRYLCALAEEERAARELERAINLGANVQHASDRIAPAARNEAWRAGHARDG
jgi:hypothetical protein